MVRNIILVGIILSFFIGCSQKVQVKSLKPAKISNNAIKKTALGTFKKDNVGLKSYIYSAMDVVEFNGKKYFTLVNREDINKILEEQKIQDSGLVNDTKKSFLLEEIHSIITGEIILQDKRRKINYVEAINYNRCLKRDKKGNCLQYARIRKRCESETFILGANIKITDVHSSRILFTKQIDKSYMQNDCNSYATRGSQLIYSELAKQIANDFISYISPSYEERKVELLDDVDIDFSSKEERLLENGLKLVEMEDYKNAKIAFEELVKSTKKASQTALYNLGVVYEVLGQLEYARISYQKAKNITLRNDMNDLIIQASRRIEERIVKQKKAQAQINN